MLQLKGIFIYEKQLQNTSSKHSRKTPLARYIDSDKRKSDHNQEYHYWSSNFKVAGQALCWGLLHTLFQAVLTQEEANSCILYSLSNAAPQEEYLPGPGSSSQIVQQVTLAKDDMHRRPTDHTPLAEQVKKKAGISSGTSLSPNARTPAAAAAVHSTSPRVVRYAQKNSPSISFYAMRSPDRQDSYGTSYKKLFGTLGSNFVVQTLSLPPKRETKLQVKRIVTP
ncbi:hypothetical protein O988_04358 [Pseudogymnoascus sp. VKM F-3808]|nr:hypothetical protein O988_04358 [Pseudogymnoascus sp. VKM F-3808]